MRLLKLVVAIAAVFTVGVAQAQKKEKRQSVHDQFTGQGYGMAGCGLGSIVFGDKPGMIQVIAATVNGTAGSQTFGISSGTSNCGDSASSAKATQFIETNRIVLEKEISRGQGETIAALSELMECKNASFGETLKSNYSNTFPQGGASAEAIQAVAYNSCQI